VHPKTVIDKMFIDLSKCFNSDAHVSLIVQLILFKSRKNIDQPQSALMVVAFPNFITENLLRLFV
jgi:hypothetical protein